MGEYQHLLPSVTALHVIYQRRITQPGHLHSTESGAAEPRVHQLLSLDTHQDVLETPGS